MFFFLPIFAALRADSCTNQKERFVTIQRPLPHAGMQYALPMQYALSIILVAYISNYTVIEHEALPCQTESDIRCVYR